MSSPSDGNAVELVDVVKRYRLHGPPVGLKWALLHLPSFVRRWRAAPVFTALDGVSLSLRRGESLGICGRNGSGKSTLLAIVAGVLRLTTGAVRVSGRVAPLLQLGAGFHPDLPGRENILLNGLLLGLRRREVMERFDRIVEFAGLREFIDEPMRTYSSGMFMRLAFAVAAHTDPEILLVDEVLAVGDLEFQRKCRDKMLDFRRRGVTILLVSHSFDAIGAMCDRALLLEAGRVAASGTPGEVGPRYLESVKPS